MHVGGRKDGWAELAAGVVWLHDGRALACTAIAILAVSLEEQVPVASHALTAEVIRSKSVPGSCPWSVAHCEEGAALSQDAPRFPAEALESAVLTASKRGRTGPTGAISRSRSFQ